MAWSSAGRAGSTTVSRNEHLVQREALMQGAGRNELAHGCVSPGSTDMILWTAAFPNLAFGRRPDVECWCENYKA